MDLLKLVNYYLGDSTSVSLSYAEQSLNISKQLNFKKGKAESLLLKGKAHRLNGDFDKALKAFKTSFQSFRELNDKNNEGICLVELGECFYRTGKRDSSLLFLDNGIEILEKSDKNKSIIAKAERIKALSFWSRGNYIQGLVSVNNSISLYRELNDSLNLSYSLNTKGAIEWGIANYEGALESYFNALYIKERIKDKVELIIILYNNIGLVYHEWDNIDKRRWRGNSFRNATRII